MTLSTIPANCAVLAQGIDALDRHGEALFRAPASTGPHFRHILDHYRCFLRGLPSGRIDYDARDRDPMLETDPAQTRAALAEVSRELSELEPVQRDHRILVHVATSADEDSAADWASSTIKRELLFLQSHTVHHFALIALLARTAGIELGEDFGVAPSTLAHRKRTLACAPSAG
ncbi:MAG TPA: hypothetical protein VLT17_05640 [Gemmatimonadales bacterium]|jgi:hypothetical protein|nr:hypothetical protein [Gemmatimonadales bacterium]